MSGLGQALCCVGLYRVTPGRSPCRQDDLVPPGPDIRLGRKASCHKAPGDLGQLGLLHL